MKKVYTNKTKWDNKGHQQYLIGGKVEWYTWHNQGTEVFNEPDMDYWLNVGLIVWLNPDAWVRK